MREAAGRCDDTTMNGLILETKPSLRPLIHLEILEDINSIIDTGIVKIKTTRKLSLLVGVLPKISDKILNCTGLVLDKVEENRLQKEIRYSLSINKIHQVPIKACRN